MAEARAPASSDVVWEATWETNGVSWSGRHQDRLAVGSYLSDYTNDVVIVQPKDKGDGNAEGNVGGSMEIVGKFEHYYPPTKLLYAPPSATGSEPELLVTSGDYLRLWQLYDGASAASMPQSNTTNTTQQQQQTRGVNESQYPVKVHLHHTFKQAAKPGVHEDFCAPLTSFDWNTDHPNMVATSSIDTTIAIWDIVAQKVQVQLIAHDKECFDVAWAQGKDIFASAGADGSVRVFDLRRMENCSIVYESNRPMLRVVWNRHDATYLAACAVDSPEVVVVDVRYPAVPAGVLKHHTAPINTIQWAPNVSNYLLSAGEDKQAIVWDVGEMPRADAVRSMSYAAEGEINCAAWSKLQPQNVAVTYGKSVRVLRF